MRVIFFAMSFLIALVGCSALAPSGGGSLHVPPENVRAGEPITLQLELTSWGASKPHLLDKRFTDIKANFTTPLNPDVQTVSSRTIRSEPGKLTVEMVIPPEAIGDAKELTYSFDFVFDGHANTHDGETLIIQD